MLTETQWGYVKHWIALVVIGEALMLGFNNYLFKSYLIVAGLFLIGFGLRLSNLYPGKPEPLILDLSAVVLALVWACIARIFGLASIRFVLIFTSSVVILPHIVYIVKYIR